MCVRCCQPFVTEAASGVSDVNPNGHVVRLSIVGCCQRFVAEAASFLGKLRDHWLSYITMTMLWCLGNFPVDLNL